MWWHSSRLDRIEANMEQMQQSITELAEISKATNLRIDRFVEEMRERTEQLQRTVEYLLSKDG
jgi:uncharacterized protein (DUF3084 family)